MAHGTPDWGVTAGAVTTYQLTDLAELAARLGSIDSFDRRGEVLFLDDFEDGFTKLSALSVGTGGRAELSTLRVRNGRYSCHLVCGSDITTAAWIGAYLPFAVLSPLGFEVSFAKETVIDYWEVLVQIYDGINLTNYRIKWYEDTTTLVYSDSDSMDVPVATDIDFTDFSRVFHVVKVVVDAPNGEYERLILNNRAFSLADISAQVVANATLPHLEFTFTVYGRATVNDEMYVGHVILTQNEPA